MACGAFKDLLLGGRLIIDAAVKHQQTVSPLATEPNSNVGRQR